MLKVTKYFNIYFFGEPLFWLTLYIHLPKTFYYMMLTHTQTHSGHNRLVAGVLSLLLLFLCLFHDPLFFLVVRDDFPPGWVQGGTPSPLVVMPLNTIIRDLTSRLYNVVYVRKGILKGNTFLKIILIILRKT